MPIRPVFKLIALLLLPFATYATNSSWYSSRDGLAFFNKQHHLYKLDFLTGIRAELIASQWVTLDSFPILANSESLYRYSRPALTSEDGRNLLNFVGSGLVYSLDSVGRPSRIDQTYFSGYNYESFCAQSGGKLFAFGGTGFWQRHALCVFYDGDLKEWELLSPVYSAPKDYTHLLSGLAGEGVFILVGSPGLEAERSFFDYPVYKVDIARRSWARLGVFSLEEGERGHEFQRIGHIDEYAFFQMDHQLYVADVVNNRLYHWNDLLTGTKSFDGYEGVFIQADQVILVYSSSTVSNPSMRILRIRKEDILSNCEPLNMPVYRSSAINFLLINKWTSLVVFLCVLFLIVFVVRYTLRQPKLEDSFVASLSGHEQGVLRHLLLLPADRFATIGDIDLLLDLSKKTWENQRKIRSTSLTHINSAAEKQLGLVGLIQRVANPEDKRERLYRISPEYIRSIPALLRNL